LKKTLCLMAVISLSFLASCRSGNDTVKGENIKTVVTILPYAGIVKEIAGNDAEVTVLIPPQSACETYEPTPVDIAKASRSAIYFSVGANYAFEKNLLKGISENYPGLKVVDCSKGIEVKDNNPHIWLYTEGLKKIAQNICDGLSQLNPGLKEAYEKNKTRYFAKIDSTDNVIKTIFNSVKKGKVFVFHPSWLYFTRQYGFEQLAVEKEGKEPTAKNLRDVIDEAKKNKIRVIFTESGTNETMAESIKEELKAEVQLLNPMEAEILLNLINTAKKISGSLK